MACSPDPRESASLTLACFPYAGGGAGIFRGWSASLPAPIEVVAVQPPGREQRLLEPAFETLEPLVRAIVSQLAPALTRPFALFGHSLGALLAYEVAHALREQANDLRYLFVSGLRAPHLRMSREPIHQLPDRSFIDAVRQLGGTPQEILSHAELMELLLPPLRADIAMYETYAPRGRPPLTCPITAFGGVSDPDVTAADLAAWRDHTTGEFTLQLFAGDHFYLRTSQEALLAAISQRLEGLLASPAQTVVPERAAR